MLPRSFSTSDVFAQAFQSAPTVPLSPAPPPAAPPAEAVETAGAEEAGEANELVPPPLEPAPEPAPEPTAAAAAAAESTLAPPPASPPKLTKQSSDPEPRGSTPRRSTRLSAVVAPAVAFTPAPGLAKQSSINDDEKWLLSRMPR